MKVLLGHHFHHCVLLLISAVWETSSLGNVMTIYNLLKFFKGWIQVIVCDIKSVYFIRQDDNYIIINCTA